MARPAKLKLNTDQVAADLHEGAGDGLEAAAEHLLAAACDVVPYDKGKLAETGEADVDKGRLRASVYFRGPYAVVQHENLDWKHPGGRTAKYLETPMHSEAGVMRELIAAELRRRLS